MELNLPQIHEAIAAVIPERECLVHRGRSMTWSEVTDRTRRFANVLRDHQVGRNGPLGDLPGWESPQDHVALYLHNGSEYLEAMLGTMKAGAAAVNVNYRYVAAELTYLLRDAQVQAVVYHEAFTPLLEQVLGELPPQKLLLRVGDGSGFDLIPGALDYEEALAEASPVLPSELVNAWSGDDLYLLYTGGTTGMPKGVCWRQADFLVSALGVRQKSGEEFSDVAQIAEKAQSSSLRALPAAPFMHGAAHWNAISAWIAGGTVVIQDDTARLDPADIWSTIDREAVTSLLIVGDAFARPLVEELEAHTYNLESLRFILTGGAALGVGLANRLSELLPHMTIMDVLGSSESGRQGTRSSAQDGNDKAGQFKPSPTAVVLSNDLDRVLPAGSHEIGWLAQSGRIPRGYLGDPEKTGQTFPTIGGVRYAVPGDRAAHLANGKIELHGRDSVTINSGGEKIFAEEVENALKHHPDVVDTVVVGRPSERWGQEVVAVVSLREGSNPTDEELSAVVAEHLARYKVPKAFVRRSEILRSPAGKADYRWAKNEAQS